MNSRQKGARGERELAAYLTAEGYPSERGQQYAGHPDAPDVRCPGLPWLHIECKRTERLSLYDAIDQARRDCGEKLPVVFHKRNRCDWLVVMRADDFMKLAREYAA